jgi:hypothetical protein
MPICVILSIRTIFPNPMLRLELFFYKGDLRPGENILFILRAPTYIRVVMGQLWSVILAAEGVEVRGVWVEWRYGGVLGACRAGGVGVRGGGGCVRRYPSA